MIHSFLLIGQSNMAGRGRRGEVAPIENPHLRLLVNGRFQDMIYPVNRDRAFSGVCLAESFADAYATAHGVDVGLIPCADGGTSLLQWREGGLLYDHAVSMARLAQRSSTIAGVLWHQGEADCHASLWPVYEEKLRAILAALRRDLALYDVPFLLGGLGDFLGARSSEYLACYPKVNEALAAVAEKDEMTGFVPAVGLPDNGDCLHFSAPALREFGLRYYAAFEKLEDKNKVFTEKGNPDDAIRTALEKL